MSFILFSFLFSLLLLLGMLDDAVNVPLLFEFPEVKREIFPITLFFDLLFIFI